MVCRSAVFSRITASRDGSGTRSLPEWMLSTFTECCAMYQSARSTTAGCAAKPSQRQVLGFLVEIVIEKEHPFSSPAAWQGYWAHAPVLRGL